MNQKNTIRLLAITVIILFGITLFLATKNNQQSMASYEECISECENQRTCIEYQIEENIKADNKPSAVYVPGSLSGHKTCKKYSDGECKTSCVIKYK